MNILKDYFMEKTPNEIKQLDGEYLNKIEKICEELHKLKHKIYEALYEEENIEKYNELVIIRNALIEEKEKYEGYSNELVTIAKCRGIYLKRLYETYHVYDEEE